MQLVRLLAPDGTGLARVPFTFFPHSNQLPNAETRIRSYVAQHRQPLIACPDGSGVVIDGATTILIGKAYAVESDDSGRRDGARTP